MGTYKLRANLVTQKIGVWQTTPGGLTTDPALVTAIFTDNASGIIGNYGGAFAGSIRFSTQFYLDGSGSPTAFNSLPSGFTIDSAILQLKCDNGMDNFPTATILMEYSALETRNISNIPFDSGLNYFFTHTLPTTALHLFGDGMGIEFTYVAGGIPVFQFFEIAGNYSISTFTFTMTPPSGNVEVGELITIEATGDDPINFSQVGIFAGATPIVPIYQDQFTFTFLIPSGLSGATVFTALGNGVQFSGSVTLGTLTILVTNGSGIYTLVLNKTDDTLYSSLRDGTTYDVKIPNPFIKTGFIGG